MIDRVARLFALTCALLLAAVALPVLGQSATAPAAGAAVPLQQDLAAWRTAREHELAVPDGWLTLIGLEWLKPGLN